MCVNGGPRLRAEAGCSLPSLVPEGAVWCWCMGLDQLHLVLSCSHFISELITQVHSVRMISHPAAGSANRPKRSNVSSAILQVLAGVRRSFCDATLSFSMAPEWGHDTDSFESLPIMNHCVLGLCKDTIIRYVGTEYKLFLEYSYCISPVPFAARADP